MMDLYLYAAVLLVGVFISAVSQVILKKEAIIEHESKTKEYLNIRVMVAYAIFVGTTFLSIFAYKVVPISMGAILESSSYIWITIFGVVIFKEKITKRKLVALGIIIFGIVLFSLSPNLE